MAQDPVGFYIERLLEAAGRGKLDIVSVWKVDEMILLVANDPDAQRTTIDMICPDIVVVSARVFVPTGTLYYARPMSPKSLMDTLLNARNQAVALSQSWAVRLRDRNSWAILSPNGPDPQECLLTLYPSSSELALIYKLVALAKGHFKGASIRLNLQDWKVVDLKESSQAEQPIAEAPLED
jgi:hypothetical protein